MVSAAENVSRTSDVDNGNENLALDCDVDLVDDEQDLGINQDVDLVNDAGVGTFAQLDDDIKNAQDGVVNLTRNYKFNSPGDDQFKEGIAVSKLTINGNGHEIDANGFSRIFNIRGGPVVLNNIKFVNGHSPKDADAGAILVTSGNLEVNNCQFVNNFAEKYGGAIASASSDSTVKIYNSKFNGNKAKFHGGAVYANNLVVDKSLFDSNGVTASSPKETGEDISLKGLGGAIFASTIKVTNTNFKKNFVANSGVYQIDEGGGAICLTHKLDCNNCNFTDNTGLKGGAIIGVYQSTFDLNPTNYVKVVNSNFVHNVAFDGGAICSNYNVTVDRCRFDNNIATGYGGGAINTGFKSNNNIFRNSVFFNNTADNYGGALATSHSHIRNCTFEYNKARHGGAIFSLSFDIAKSVLHDNVATVGNNVVVVDGFKKDDETYIPESEFVIYSQHEVHDFTVDVLNGQSSTEHFITSGKYEGYQQYCVEERLYLPEHTEGVMTKDLSYITNSYDRTLVSDYIKIMFYLLDAYPEKYGVYANKVQDTIWIFTDSNYRDPNNQNQFIREIIRLHDQGFSLNETTYILPNGTKMVYDMQLFLTPTDRQNMVLFKSSLFVPVYNETVTKKTIDPEVYVGKDVRFKITVTNTGNMNLTDVFVNDTQYDDGLVFKNKWYSVKGDWTYKNNGIWVLKNVLEPGDDASFVVVFNTKVVGQLQNNVTSGYLNITLSNSTNTTKTVNQPKMTVIKISNNKVVKVGKRVSFTIIVKNTGDCDLTGVYVIDTKYTQGLEYEYFTDPTDSWKYKGNGRWDYVGVLKAHEQTPGLRLYFIAKKTGLQYNTVTAGNNLTNKTVNSTNTTNVTKDKKKHPKHHDEKKKHHDKKKKHPKHHDKKKKHHDKKKRHKHHDKKTHHKSKHKRNIPSKKAHVSKKAIFHDENATGNPLFALLLVLISLGVITFRRKI